ncbi:unnamed protein product [Alopecurus aequalis]
MMKLRKYWGVGGRRCGACEASPAAVHCRTCAGYLCTGCDASPAHARAGHERVWVCEVCEVNPAAVTCKADAAVLCAACDADIHDANPLAQRHVRVPVAPIGSPEAAAVAAEAMNMFAARTEEEADAHHGAARHEQQHGMLNLNVEAGKEGGKQMDYLFSDLVDPYVSLDYARFPHADSVVPSGAGAVPTVELDFAYVLGANAKPPSSYSSYTATATVAHSGSSSEVGVVPDATFVGGGIGSFELDFTRPKLQTYTPYNAAHDYPTHGVSMQQVSPVDNTGYMTVPERVVAVTGEDREARLMRYREKRKNRRFEKTIRYASRKAYAESRPRVKGRFTKRTDNDADDADAEAGVPCSYLLDFGYGVVPSF